MYAEASAESSPPIICRPTPPREPTVRSKRVRGQNNVSAVQALAHDLRGPIANLSLLIERLGQLGRDDETKSIDACLEKADRLIERVDEMLRETLRRACSHAQPLTASPARINLARIMKSSLTSHQSIAQKRGVILEISCNEPLMLDADDSLLLRALDNLISNAIRHTRQGGTVRCEAGVNDGRVIVTVADEGPGFAVADFERVFQAFTTLSARNETGGASHGLGLWIVKQIADQHGGTVSVRNKSGGPGAMVTMELPLSPL